jgi:peptidoglycan-associated lipoprotein
MRNLTLPVLLLSGALGAASLAGCGDKAKKKTVATTPVVADAPGPSGDSQEPASEGDSSANLEKVVYFEFDSSDLDEAAKADLQENADWMAEDTSRVLTIEGHTDEAGTTDYNLALGERRARVTKDYLVRLGVDASRVQIITYGEERPASSDDALNRRSVFVATRK